MRKHGLKTLVTAAATCLVVVTGCGQLGARTQALNELSSQVHTIRGAASVGDFETALERLDALRSRAWEMFRQNELPQGDLENILAAAEAVESHLPLSANPPPQPPVEVDEPAPQNVDEDAEEARQQAEEEAKKQQEEAQKQAEEAARKQAEEAARKQAEEEAKRREEAQKQAEEAAKEKQKDQPKEQEQAESGDEGEDGEDNANDD